ncbi:hypothetical protein ACFX2A_006825 [Malus domestica]
MVDVLARGGQVVEAYHFICQMPKEPTASILGALLSRCMNHGELDLAEIVGKKLIEIQPDHDGRYIGLSNVYAFSRRWDDSRSLREAMERRGVKKSPGFSFVEIFGTLHKFIAHDKSYPESGEIYRMLNFIIQKKKIWELVQPHMKTDSSCIALLGEHVMRTSAGVVISTSLKNANIS